MIANIFKLLDYVFVLLNFYFTNVVQILIKYTLMDK